MTEKPGSSTQARAREQHQVKVLITLGILVRRQALRQILDTIWELDLTCDWQEDKGWFDSRYRFKIIGNPEDLARFVNWYRDWEHGLNGAPIEEAEAKAMS